MRSWLKECVCVLIMKSKPPFKVPGFPQESTERAIASMKKKEPPWLPSGVIVELRRYLYGFQIE